MRTGMESPKAFLKDCCPACVIRYEVSACLEKSSHASSHSFRHKRDVDVEPRIQEEAGAGGELAIIMIILVILIMIANNHRNNSNKDDSKNDRNNSKGRPSLGSAKRPSKLDSAAQWSCSPNSLKRRFSRGVL